MLNVHELERRWLRYKIKSLLPVFTVFFSLVILAVIALYVWPSQQKSNHSSIIALDADQNQNKPSPSTNGTPVHSEVVKTNEETVAAAATATASAPSSEQLPVTLKPSMNFIRDIEEEISPYYENDNASSVTKKVQTEKVQTQKVHVAEIVDDKQSSAQVPEEEVIEEEKHTVSISAKKSDDDLKDVIRRFNLSNNPVLSLFIAKRYYEMGEYSLTYEYALKTNELNSKIDESWILFSKALVKLGKKEMAIKTLKAYVEHSDSIEARVLLDNIAQGTFE